MKEEGIEIDVKDISDFKNHPFKINNDLNYEELKNSIQEAAKYDKEIFGFCFGR